MKKLLKIIKKNVIGIALPKHTFIEGAKWQQERSYSEEEVLKIIQDCKSYLSFGDEFDEIEWFEQFKKK